MNQCTWRSDLWSTLSDNHHLPISFISLAFLVFEFLVMVMSYAISDKTRRWVSNLNLSWQGMIDKQFLLTYYQYKERCFLSCHECGTKKKSESSWGIKPQTFQLCASMLYHWATKTPQWARSIMEFILSIFWQADREWWYRKIASMGLTLSHLNGWMSGVFRSLFCLASHYLECYFRGWWISST